MSDSPEFRVSPAQALSRSQRPEFFQVAKKRRPEGSRGCCRIVMSAAGRLGDDLVDKFELEKITAGDSQVFCSLWCSLPISPENGSAALGTDDRIVGILEDQYAIGDAD